MTGTVQHAAHLGRRIARDAGVALRYGVPGHVAAVAGAGGAAVRAQAGMIRHVEACRESLWAYRRLRRLMARHGDGGLALTACPPRPGCFVVFVGQSRSGHSLVGSLLDAHPEIAIAHEHSALKHLAAGTPFDDVLAACTLNAQIFQRLGRHYTGYDYTVPGQDQGTWTRLAAAGDKKGNGSVRVLRRRPEAAAAAERRLPVPICYINVVRNPWDNAATKALRTGRDPRDAARIVAGNARAIAALEARTAGRLVTVHLDDLIADPERELTRLVDALGAAPPGRAYLDACAGVLFRSPSRTRERVTWPAAAEAELAAACREVPFLARYARRGP